MGEEKWRCPICNHLKYTANAGDFNHRCNGCSVVFADPKKFNFIRVGRARAYGWETEEKPY